jgi:hypothetical protein
MKSGGLCAEVTGMRFQMNCLAGRIGAQLLTAFFMISSPLFLGADETQASSQQASPAETKGKSVVDITAGELRRLYSKDLSNIEFDPSQEQLDSLLEKAGERVVAFFRDFTNTSSKEQVRMQRYITDRLLNRSDVRITGLDKLSPPALQDSLWKEFNYLILPRPGKAGISLAEYRTDKENRPVDRKATRGFIISSGYAALCLYLHPAHQANSRFRYLGRETRKPCAYVVAFAQKPESRDYLAQFSDVDTQQSIRFLVQGLVWLEPDSRQVMRMKTSMQSAERASSLREQITDVICEKVEFDNTRQQFWLPREVSVSWEFPDYTYRNLHKYSDYHLFAVESDYKVTQPKASK